VARLGEILASWVIVYFLHFKKSQKKISGLVIYFTKYLATFWAFFSQNHLVTLLTDNNVAKHHEKSVHFENPYTTYIHGYLHNTLKMSFGKVDKM
jgi:hypothetical protein